MGALHCRLAVFLKALPAPPPPFPPFHSSSASTYSFLTGSLMLDTQTYLQSLLKIRSPGAGNLFVPVRGPMKVSGGKFLRQSSARLHGRSLKRFGPKPSAKMQSRVPGFEQMHRIQDRHLRPWGDPCSARLCRALPAVHGEQRCGLRQLHGRRGGLP